MTLPTTHTLAEVAASLRVHPRTLRRAIARTDLPVTRVGAGVRLTDAQVRKLSEVMECRLGSPVPEGVSGMSAGPGAGATADYSRGAVRLRPEARRREGL